MKLTPDQKKDANDLLLKLEVFAGCSPDEIQALVEAMELVEFAKTKVILMEQELSRNLYVVYSGSIGIWRREKGTKKLLATLSNPDFFGERSMFTESPATALVKAEEDSKLFKLPHDLFKTIAAKFPELSGRILKNLEAINAKRPAIVKPQE